MARLGLAVLVLFVAQATSKVVQYNAVPSKTVDKEFLQRQLDISALFFHINEPIYNTELKTIAETYDLVKNAELYKNEKVFNKFVKMQENNILLPRSVPFNVLEEAQKHEATTLFNLLISAKDYSTFLKTAVYLRERINEGLFVYVLSVAVLHFPETQDIVIPPFYDVFPSYYHNGYIMSIAERINTQGKRVVEYYPQTYVWDENVVIRWNATLWPYLDGDDTSMSYYLNDYALNTLYYNHHITSPFWLSGADGPLAKYRRGEFFWLVTKQYVTRYYMERLSNGFGEIPELNYELVQDGYFSGLVYDGISFPVRPENFNIDQAKYVKYVENIKQIEERIKDAIDLGYVITSTGEKIDLRTPDSIDVLGKMIEGNVDSPNLSYYGSIVTAWKELLGNAIESTKTYWNGVIPLAMPSTLELYQTSLRDPAFYMIMKRVLGFYTMWKSYLPLHQIEEIAYPTVSIEKVEVDKLSTYFEYAFLNVTNALPMNDFEITSNTDQVSVLVQRPQLNHKVFSVRINVKSNAAKTVVVKFFLAPKYDSKGVEIPLHLNTENFFLFDQFTYELPAGESVITRESTDVMYMVDKWMSSNEVYTKAFNALHENGEFVIDMKNYFIGFPRRLMLPKGCIGGMPFKFLVYITEYVPPEVPYGNGVNPEGTYGMGTGSARMTGHPYAFPLDRPLYDWQIKDLSNLKIEEVQVSHKPVPEIDVPNFVYV